MSHPARCFGAVVIAFVFTVVLDAGGWAVVSVVRTPDTVIAGEPVTVTWAVRQHGQHLVDGLGPRGRIDARLGETVIHVPATALPEKGHYAATLKFPTAGAWTLDIVSGFGGMHGDGRAVMRVVEPGTQVPVLSPEERGHRLFVSKGCERCHSNTFSNAPQLNPSGYETNYLARFLTSPPKPTGNEWRMPDLGLTSDEVASLVAFINSPRSSKSAVRATR
jgi:hypothetical protein